ncbi:3-dehydroquinate synthase [Pullulanibacillus sp. KACC 23026]|uniref:3-dehydroquinate synthase n=1 Tax=Pullulanibacillus sp. KACC 23026 TaxID=3028315 RepID=UPI0023B0717C|nr:3-dehydroquinate synthase [Pullulanibacillus sp. KACC 23026]WEG11371.1 3-dehydroquinate synthase [Pullulanibacillus sp. KACC 23026]
METLWIRAASKTYPIYLGENLLNQLQDMALKTYSSYFIITDDAVAPLYLDQVTEAFSSYGPVHHAVVPSGEPSKSFAVYSKLLDQLLELNLDRKACILALGGGVVGDLAGFVAATYLRGVSWIQLPTTLLAHDSSVGGKVGINHAKGKNLIGAFYHPDAVIYNTTFLESLPPREWRSGFSELIKHSLLESSAFFEELRAAIPDKSHLSVSAVTPFIGRGIRVKAAVVDADELEQGQRAFLNLGHTLGHALEKVSGYGVLTHGEGVAIGLLFALQLSEAWYGNQLPTETLREWLNALDLPVRVPADLEVPVIFEAMKRDKKRLGNQVRFVLLEEIGKPALVEIPEADILEQLSKFMKSS